MKTNTVREKLRRGEVSVGTWLNLPDPTVATVMTRVGFDWLTVELEHSPTTLVNATLSMSIIAGNGLVPLVRIASNTAENIKRALDCGAWGVVVPMVNSPEEAEAVVAAARYAPLGARTIGGQLHAASFDTDSGTYYAQANDHILVAVMAEHVNAIERADEILRVPGIDLVFIGPNDLTHSMGIPPCFDTEDPRYVHALDHILKTAKKYGIATGIHVADAAGARKRIEQGFQFIAVASDIGLMVSKSSEVTRDLGLGPARGPLVKY